MSTYPAHWSTEVVDRVGHGMWDGWRRVLPASVGTESPAVTYEAGPRMVVVTEAEAGRVIVAGYPNGSERCAAFVIVRTQDAAPAVEWARAIADRDAGAAAYTGHLLVERGYDRPARVSQ